MLVGLCCQCEVYMYFSGKPSSLPDHPDYVPSVFHFTPAHKTTPNHTLRFERLHKRRLPMRSLTEELANIPTEQSDRDTAASALLGLGTDLPKFQETGE